MRTLNLGILAHVDAGKTTLTERLLYAAGVIDEIGNVDDGNTQTDSLALERQRGITIKSAVVSFVIGDHTVNLIDTPGHPDFIAEVERVLNVLDGAVLVISAVESVQAQTRVLMRALRRLRLPTLVFVNKLDRSGADPDRVLRDIAEKLTPAIVPMGSASGLGTRAPGFMPYGRTDEEFRSRLVDLLSEHDDSMVAAYVDDENALSYDRLRAQLARQTKLALTHPVYFGSAISGAGVDELTIGLQELLPTAQGDPTDPLSGTVFKVERGPAGEKVAYARVFGGLMRTRERVRFGRAGQGGEAKVTAIQVFDRGRSEQRSTVAAGQIGKLWGLSDVRIGDRLGIGELPSGEGYFAPPTLETVVVPVRAVDKGNLHLALSQLAEQDPLINLRQDDVRQELSLSLYGEVQKEVIQSTLQSEFGVEVAFHESTTICVERPTGTGAAVEPITRSGSTHQSVLPTMEHEFPNPFLAGVGLRVDPGPIGSGVEFRLEIELGSLLPSFLKAIEETVRTTLSQGLNGWQVLDCVVTLTHSQYVPRQGKRGTTFDPSISTSAGDFRHLTPLVLIDALRQAGSTVYEPMHRFAIDVPADTLGGLLPVLGRIGAVPETPTIRGSSCTVEGAIPAARVYELQRELPSLTRGEGVLESAFDHYQPVRGEPPARPRTDLNPLNRREYLLRVQRREPTGRG